MYSLVFYLNLTLQKNGLTQQKPQFDDNFLTGFAHSNVMHLTTHSGRDVNELELFSQSIGQTAQYR